MSGAVGEVVGEVGALVGFLFGEVVDDLCEAGGNGSSFAGRLRRTSVEGGWSSGSGSCKDKAIVIIVISVHHD